MVPTDRAPAEGASRLESGSFRALVAVCLSVILSSVDCVWRPLPPYQFLHVQGIERTIVVAPSVGASDAELRRIAEHFIELSSLPVGQRAVVLHVWTDLGMAPAGDLADMTSSQAAARVAVVTINEQTRFTAVERPQRDGPE